MSVDVGFPLTRDYVRTAPQSSILDAVKNWLKREDPICLMHPHGFYVVLLCRTETEEWRFHFWPKGSRTITGMPAFIHTHDRHIESRILQGSLTNILYDVELVQIGGQPVYQVGYNGDRYASATSNILYKTTTRVHPIIANRNTIELGSTYNLERHTYHQAVVPDEFATSTLVCMHGHEPGTVMVLGLEGYPETISFRREVYSALTIAEQLMT